MKQFRTGFIGGYQKKDVNDYLEALIQEMEGLKEDADRKLREERDAADELKRQLEQERSKSAKLQEQIPEYEQRIAELEERLSRDGADEEKVKTLQEKLEKYDQIMPNLADLMSNAKMKADLLVEKSEEDAKKIRDRAEEEALRIQTKTEAELNEKKREQEQKFLFAKYKILDYLNAVSESQKKLISAYNELGFLVKELPLRMDDTFPEEETVVVDEDGQEILEREQEADIVK